MLLHIAYTYMVLLSDVHGKVDEPVATRRSQDSSSR